MPVGDDASISTTLPSLGSIRRQSTSTVAAVSSASAPAFQRLPFIHVAASGRSGGPPASSSMSANTSKLTRSSSVTAEYPVASGHQQQRRASPLDPPLLSSKSTTAAQQSQPTIESPHDSAMHVVVSLIKSRDVQGFKGWVKTAESVNIQDFAGNTPLHWACHKGLPEFVNALLRRPQTPADCNIINRNGATPLHIAASSGIGAIVDLLLTVGKADPMIPNANGRTFFDVLRAKGHVELDEAYRGLEDEYLRKANPEPLSALDNWLDASRLGAESEPSESDPVPHPPADLISFTEAELPSPIPPGVGLSSRGSRADASASSAATSPAAGGGGSVPRVRQRLDMAAASQGGRDVESKLLDLERELQKLRGQVHQQQQRQLPQQPPLHAGSLQEDQNTTVPVFVSSPRVIDPGSPPPATAKTFTFTPAVNVPTQQRYIGPTGRILCSCCDVSGDRTDGHLQRPPAVGYCDECRCLGDPCWLCEDCWQSEHAAKRKRLHRRGPVPIPQQPLSHATGNSLTPRGAMDRRDAAGSDGGSEVPTGPIPFDISQLTPEAKSYLLLQQQLIRSLASAAPVAPGAVASRATSGGTQTTFPVKAVAAETQDAAVQTMEGLQASYFDEAIMELNDVRSQLEVEVSHSQLLIDATRLQLLEALELRHRSEIESMCWRRLLNMRKPPQVVVVFAPNAVPEFLRGIETQLAGPIADDAFRSRVEERVALLSRGTVVLSSTPPLVQVTASPLKTATTTTVGVNGAITDGSSSRFTSVRHATASMGIQCDAPTDGQRTSTTEVQTEHTGEEPAPPKEQEAGAHLPRYALDAVEVVHGEKHLPNQPQMLLVRWARGGMESWVAAYEVAHCTAVVAYLSRYDKSFNGSLLAMSGSMPTSRGSSRAGGSRAGSGSVSPLNDTERTQLSQQLAQLKHQRKLSSGGTPESSAQGGAGGRDGRGSFQHVTTRRPSGGGVGGKPPLPNKTAGASSATSKPTQKATTSQQQGSGSRKGAVETPLQSTPFRELAAGSFEATEIVPVDDDDIPMPPRHASLIPNDLVESTPMPETPDAELVRRYEDRLKELEQKQEQLRRLRAEQVDRIAVLKTKQQLLDENRRADVHREYEARKPYMEQQELQAGGKKQQQQQNALLSTTDKHAALVLQELQQEVNTAEQQKRFVQQQRQQQKQQPEAPSSNTNKRQQEERRVSQAPATATAADSTAITDPPSMERKINRILYEQYFYNRAVNDGAK